MLKPLLLVPLLLLVSACTSFGVVDNDPLSGAPSPDTYSIKTVASLSGSDDISLLLAFSGGGTRAAALAYGVLQELRDTKVLIDGQPRRVLDEIDMISSVSGGSFTSAYYALNGDRIFEDFEEVFLRRDVQGMLIRGVLSPQQWFSDTGRTELAVKYYEDVVFHGATFADMKEKGGPLVLINASDLGYGVRFTFVQEFFNLLCSDISTFPVARAVTASSAVPMLFNPVVMENYPDCKSSQPAWLTAARQRSVNDPQLTRVVDGLSSYHDTEKRPYAHFVDGGITDNLGLRAIYEIVEVAGGPQAFMEKLDRDPPRQMVIISVNASTDAEPKMDLTTQQPSIEETVNAVTDVQLHLYNNATLELMTHSIKRWAEQMSAPNRAVTPYFVQLGFHDIEEAEHRKFFNRVPTSFSLTDEQVDRLIAAGRDLLRDNPDFQRFVADLNRTKGNTRH